MPIYTYACEKCKKDFTRLCRIPDRDNQTCDCKEPAQRKPDAPGHKLNGTGYYATDFKYR